MTHSKKWIDSGKAKGFRQGKEEQDSKNIVSQFSANWPRHSWLSAEKDVPVKHWVVDPKQSGICMVGHATADTSNDTWQNVLWAVSYKKNGPSRDSPFL